VILAPRSFLSEAYQIWASEMMMMADLAPAHAAEERFGVVAVDALAQAVRLLMVDPVHREPAVKLVPRAGAYSGIKPRICDLLWELSTAKAPYMIIHPH